MYACVKLFVSFCPAMQCIGRPLMAQSQHIPAFNSHSLRTHRGIVYSSCLSHHMRQFFPCLKPMTSMCIVLHMTCIQPSNVLIIVLPHKRSWKESIMLTVVLDCLSLEHVLVLRSAKSIDDNVWVYDLSMLIASGWLGQSLSTDYLRREGEKEGGRGRGRGWEGEGGREREGEEEGGRERSG